MPRSRAVRDGWPIVAGKAGADTVVVPPEITLGPLSLSPNTATVGVAYSGTITGKTGGSTISLTGAGAGGLSPADATVSGTPTTAGALNLVETLAGATNTPRTTNSVLTVVAPPAVQYAALFGDSRLANGIFTSTTDIRQTHHGIGRFLQSASSLKLRCPVTMNKAVAGRTSATVLSNVSADITAAQSAATVFGAQVPFAVLFVGTNDYPSTPTSAQTLSNISGTIDALKAAFGKVVVFTDTARGNATFPTKRLTTAQQTKMDEVRAGVTALASSTVKVVDGWGLSVDGAGPDVKAGFTYDGLHPSPSGARSLGNAVWAAASEWITATGIPGLLDFATGSRSRNALMAGTGGTLGTAGTGGSVSGQVADSFTWHGVSSWRANLGIAYSKVTEDGLTWQQAAYSGTPTANPSLDIIRQTHSQSVGGDGLALANLPAGTVVQAICRVRWPAVAAGARAGVQSSHLGLELSYATNNSTTRRISLDGYHVGTPVDALTAVTLGDEAADDWLLTEPLTVAAGQTLNAAEIRYSTWGLANQPLNITPRITQFMAFIPPGSGI